MKNTNVVSFKLNNLQFDTIRKLYNHYGLNFEVFDRGKKSFGAVSFNDHLSENEQQSDLIHPPSSLFCLFLLLYVPCQQLWSLRDGQFT